MAYARRKKLLDGSVRWYAAYLGGDGRYHEEGGFRSRREAERVAAKREVDADRGEWASPVTGRMTFTKYVDNEYWPTTAHLEISTRTAYRSYLDKHFLPRLGPLAMRRVAASTVQSWVNDAAATGGLSARSIGKYHALLHKIFARAVIDRVVPVNPCAHTELPKVIVKAKRIITTGEFDAILAAIPLRHRMMVLLTIETGLRWGELIALRPLDIDFPTRTVNVRRTIGEVSRKHSPTGERFYVKDSPKSDVARLVQIQQETCLLLREYMLARGVREADLFFTSEAGTSISRNNFRTKVWLPALTTAKIQGTVTFHNLRAAHASWLLAGGADLQVVKERLGHRQITTTQQYLGTLPDAGDRALAAFRKIRNGR